ncbi:MAG: hypothetical protein WC563_15630 [Brevundimonas sp.]
MKRLVLALLLTGCTTVEPTTVLMMYQSDAATTADAASEPAQDATVDLVPGVDAATKPDAATTPPDATGEEAATDATIDAPPCPGDMALVGIVCVDTREVKTDEYKAWLAIPLDSPIVGCIPLDFELPQPVAIPLASATWCGMQAWCVDHGKRMCWPLEWQAACEASIDPTSETKLGAEWLFGGDMPGESPWMVGTIHPSCAMQVIQPGTLDSARIRCCKDAQ